MKELSCFFCFLFCTAQIFSLQATFLIEEQVLKEIASSVFEDNIPKSKQISARSQDAINYANISSFNQNHVPFPSVGNDQKVVKQQSIKNQLYNEKTAQVRSFNQVPAKINTQFQDSKIDLNGKSFHRVAPKFIVEIVKQELKEEPASNIFKGLGTNGNSLNFHQTSSQTSGNSAQRIVPVSNRINSYSENKDGNEIKREKFKNE